MKKYVVEVRVGLIGQGEIKAYEVAVTLPDGKTKSHRWLWSKISGPNFIPFVWGVNDWIRDLIEGEAPEGGQTVFQFKNGGDGSGHIPSYYFEVLRGAIRERSLICSEQIL